MTETPPPRDEAYVDQALHGYSDGHRLLSSSRPIPRGAQRVMLAMSDRSGPGRPKGFESYLTGYPLPELRSYAVARTWHAPEMSRPGCVWTHTLLIPESTLARLSTLRVFDGLFRRPEGLEVDRDAYAARLSLAKVRVSQTRDTGSESAESRLRTRVLAALYGVQTDHPVFLLADGADQWQRLVFEIWAQQWGGLRSRFSFCTGSVSPRSLADRPLDFQVVPRSRYKGATRGEGVLLDPYERPEETDPERLPVWPGAAWLPAAEIDLDRGDASSPFRRSLRLYAADVAPARSSFAPVASFVASGFDLGPDALWSASGFLAKEFPSAVLAARLKTAVLGRPDIRDPEAKDRPASEEEMDRLEVVLTLSACDAFDPEALDVEARVQGAVEHRETRRDLAARLLGRRRNVWGDAAFGTLIGKMSATEIGDVFDWDEDLLADVLERNPRLVEEPAVWQAPSSVQRFVLRTVASTLAPDSDVWPALVSAVLDAGSDLAAGPIHNVIGRDAAGYALNWTSTGGRRQLPPDWSRLVLDEPDLLLGWIETRKGAPTLTTCALVGQLSPTDRRVLALDVSPLVVVADQARAAVERGGKTAGGDRLDTYASALAVLLAIGLRSSSGEPLVRSAFAPVHALAKEGMLGWKRWRLLSSLGSAPDWAVWDRPSNAEQLERAAVGAYLRRGWPPFRFAEAMPDQVSLRRALSYASKSSKSGRRFAQKVWKAAR